MEINKRECHLDRDFPPTAALPTSAHLHRIRSTLSSVTVYSTANSASCDADFASLPLDSLWRKTFTGVDCLAMLQVRAKHSHIHQLCYTNEPPDDGTVHAVREIIHRSKLQLSTTLGENHVQLATTIERHQAILSPLRRLPTEILCEIFLAVKDASYEMCIHDLDVRLGPWVLGRVCSRWREIALHCRPLWTTLDVALTNSMGQRFEKHSADILQEYLSRSGSQTLDVTLLFAYRRSPRPNEIPEMTKILDLIVGESHRWNSLRLDMNGRVRLSDFILVSLVRARNNIPVLQRVDFGLCQDLSDVDLILDSAPLLRSISTTFDLESERIPWQQLTRYTHGFRTETVDTAWIFRQAPNLVECRIDSCNDAPSSEHVTLQDLHLLQLGTTGPLECLTAPHLESLTVPSCDYALASFIRRVLCLRSLTLTGPMSGDDLTSFFPDLKHLEILRLHEIEVTDAFLVELAHPKVLPNLEVLEMECIQDTPFNVALLFHLIETRRRDALRSTIISIDAEGHSRDKWEERIHILKNDGYVIEFM